MISKRALDIPPFMVMEIMERAHQIERTGSDVVHLEVGEPDFDTPPAVKEAAERAIAEGKTHYTHSMGIIELREAISEYYLDRYGVPVPVDRIIVTAGTSPALLLVFAALLEAGDQVAIPNPSYSCYPHFIRFSGGEPLYVDVFEEDGFQYRMNNIREKLTSRTKAVMVNSPSNPTGNLISAESLLGLTDLGPTVVSDEIYHGLVYEGRENSVLEYTDRAIVLNGFSKLYAMTGWRLGYVIAPPQMVRAIQKLQQNFFISAGSVAQWAGIAALRDTKDDVERMLSLYNQRRKLIIGKLRELGFGITVEPTGAFYVLANAGHLSRDSKSLAFDILEKAHVGVAPGVDFGSNAEGYLRFCYANSIENIEEGMNRLAKYIEVRS